jgi:hypothetical protein
MTPGLLTIICGDSPVRGVFTGRSAGCLIGKNAVFANPSILVQLIEWADKLLTE